jgi:hypothetical protein
MGDTSYTFTRHEAGGVAGLVELSRAPHAHPHAIGDGVRSLFVDARNKHPGGAAPTGRVATPSEASLVASCGAVGEILKNEGRPLSNPVQQSFDKPSRELGVPAAITTSTKL